MLKSVDLPQPEGPISARNSPALTEKETSSSAETMPSAVGKRFVTFSTASAAGGTSPSAAVARSFVAARAMLVSPLSLRPARDVGGSAGVIAAGDAHIDDRNLAGIDRFDRFLEARIEIGELLDRPNTDGALRARDPREVDIGPDDLLADPLIRHRPLALLGDALLMQLVIVEGAVVADDDQQRDTVMDCGPDRRVPHHEIAVADDR